MKFLKWTSIIVIAALMAWHIFLRQHHLAFVPEEMNVSRILYVEEKSWGFGPGGNETGLIMYELPKETAQDMISGGLSYLSSFPSAKLGKPHSRQGKYRNWYATPLTRDNKSWFERPTTDELGSTPKLDNYLNRYGFGIQIKCEVKDMVEKTVSSEGNYYAYGRTGMIIVAPSIRRVFYIYVG